MPKIQNIGIGNYIRNPRGTGATTGGVKSREVMQVFVQDGNQYRCHPVINARAVPVTLDMKRYIFIPVDTEVETASP